MGKYIFVSKQAGIGDVLLTTPILTALKQHYPDCHLTLMILPNAYDIVQGLPCIDEIFVYQKKQDGILKLYRKLREQDVAILLDQQYRPALLAALAMVPVRVGLAHKRGFWLTKSVQWQEYMDHRYEPYVQGDIVRETLGLDIPEVELGHFHLPPVLTEEKAALARLLAERGLRPREKYIVCSPVTAYFLKNWPFERWNELFVRLHRELGLRTVIFGNEQLEFGWDAGGVIDICGRLNLRQVDELIRGACLLVNGSSLPEHIAAALGKPCVLLYGYSDPERWPPRHSCTVIRAGLPCSPCDGYRGVTCKDPRCMRAITVERVFEACRQRLQAID